MSRSTFYPLDTATTFPVVIMCGCLFIETRTVEKNFLIFSTVILFLLLCCSNFGSGIYFLSQERVSHKQAPSDFLQSKFPRMQLGLMYCEQEEGQILNARL